jgi:hypothetical protein
MGAAFVTTGDEASLMCRRRRAIMNSESRAFKARKLAQALRNHARETQMPEYASMMLRAARELEGLAATASANNSGNSLLAFA